MLELQPLVGLRRRAQGDPVQKNPLPYFAHNRLLLRRSHGSHVNSLAGVAHKGIL